MTSPAILQNDAFNELLRTNGYAIVPFLGRDEITTLTDFFYANHPQLPEGMYASSHAADFEFRKKMNDEIKRICSRAIAATFCKALPLGATFMVKSKGENGSLQPHQDWNIVDEKQFNSYNIWLPLVDVTEKNGTLLILPGSHLLFENIRGLNIPASFEKVTQVVWKYLVPLEVKAGEALIYDHRLLHASGINRTDTPRLVIVYGIMPETAAMRYYYGRDGFIEEYACTPDFYFNEQITQGPAGLPLIRKYPNDNPVMEPTEFERMYGGKSSLLKKALKLFSR